MTWLQINAACELSFLILVNRMRAPTSRRSNAELRKEVGTAINELGRPHENRTLQCVSPSSRTGPSMIPPSAAERRDFLCEISVDSYRSSTPARLADMTNRRNLRVGRRSEYR
jgi:hypothetical protein